MSSSKYNTSLVFIAACAGMAFFGIAMLSLAPILGRLNSVVEGAIALPSTMSIGIMLGTIIFGPVVDRAGYKGLIIISSVLALAGLQGLSIFSDIVALHASIFCLGLGGGILNGLTNALVSDIYDDDRRSGRLGLLGGFYCIGALLWTLLNYFIADYHIPLNAMSIVMVACIVFFCCISFPKAKPVESAGLKATVSLLKYPALILFAIVLFFESGFEGCSGSYTVEFFDKTTSMGVKTATLAMTWFTIGMLAGRIPLGAITAKLKDFKTLYTYLSVALVGVIVFALAKSSIAAYISMILIGFGVGATYPVVLNYIGGAFRAQSGTAMSIALFIALIGQFTFNKITGACFGSGSYIVLPILLVTAVICMMCIVPIAIKISKKQ